MSFTLALGRYNVQNETERPCRGRSILSQYDNETIIVYQTISEQVNDTSNTLYTFSNGITDIDKEVVDDACKDIDSDQWEEESVCSELDDSSNEDETGDCKEVKESKQSNIIVEVELCSKRIDVDKDIDALTNRHDVHVDKAPDRSNTEGNNQLNETSSQRDESSEHGIMGTISIEYTDDVATTSEVACTEYTNDVATTSEVACTEYTDDVATTSEVAGTEYTDDVATTSEVACTEYTDDVATTSEVACTEYTNDVATTSEVACTEYTDDVATTSEVAGTEYTDDVATTSEVVCTEYTDDVATTSEVAGTEYTDDVATTSEVVCTEYTDDVATTSEAACTEDYTQIIDEGSESDEFVWLQTSFVRTMYDCGWGTLSRQRRSVIAISLKKDGFDEILKSYVDEFKNGRQTGKVILQWSPDRSPRGEMLKRLVPQIGLRGDILVKFKHEWTLGTKDISEYIEHQRRLAHTGNIVGIWTPKERDYVPVSLEIRGILRLQCENSVQTEDNSDVFEYGSLTDTLADVYSTVTENTRDVIFYLYGAFNPMHSGHVSAIVDGKDWLENTANYNVIETRVAIATDDTVRGKATKSNDICITFEHRRKLCEFACSKYPWIMIHPLPVDSQPNYGKQIRIELDKPNAKLVLLVGSDRASLPQRKVGALWAENRFILCVGRKGMSTPEKQKFEDAKKNDPDRSHAFYVVPTKQNNISSTGIRKKLMQFKEGTSKRAIAKGSHIVRVMIERDWLTEDGGEYILQHIHDLYLPK